MALKPYIGNPNYSSWLIRAGVLLRAFDIDHGETLIRFDSFDASSAFKTELQRVAGTGAGAGAGAGTFLVD